ncbi:FliA/WhiG family RNA polymerase sigma factor [Clostridium cochlearium]|jgi:RNA polymerase sigma factor for flagellar operon FliA|uniref:RNA polymerase sigma factor for flagellar operon fliA n=1 Tax=Clostridium cochlearium TaxID=1494 RepID=A0A240ACN4_CLOCO|nr:FliA/WhiG family RNA polymerase sigma factor [Clostridium cochlearium]MBE6065284.1 FliA/WhiG family RNA polymerase sigma factor [Clostridium cochlearium]MBU5269053.1 FliA/WhiG family RNA polymerase sigma factor [Clostridium cochlearium]MCR1970357.1 FliA/WhiG family RNA polymerase sigma factor [Clostridium cochlearium]MDU1442819.1 FliA/WhiG family RNA polymerase sigma factor [Clostridium cochlearium]NMA58291.1 FliA/WhiG family RNA polymerase sigma factor [Clostridium cochlearium]
MSIAETCDVKEELVKKYIPLVKYIASRVIIGKTKYIDYDDLVGYGMLGLMDAMKKFDPSKGMKFSTYASIRIRGSMIDELRRISPIPKSAMDKLNKYNEAVEKLQMKNFKEPKLEEVAKELDMSLKEVSQIENYINYISVVSLEDFIFSDDEDISLMSTVVDKDSPSPEKTLEEKELIEYLEKAINKLKERDRIVLSLYYYERLTLKEIGKVLEVSESRVCQLHSRAIVHLRNELKKLKIINY